MLGRTWTARGVPGCARVARDAGQYVQALQHSRLRARPGCIGSSVARSVLLCNMLRAEVAVNEGVLANCVHSQYSGRVLTSDSMAVGNAAPQ